MSTETLTSMVHALINGDREEAAELIRQTLETKTRDITGIPQPEAEPDLDLDLTTD